jgi:LysM repeat protein
MSADNPLLPQGSLWEQKQQSRSRVRTAFFCVLAVHVLAIGTVLIVQGCKREEPPPATYPELSPVLPSFDTNLPPVVSTEAPPAVVQPSTVPALPTVPQPPVSAPAPTPVTPSPTVSAPAPTAPAAGGTEYRVVAGDTLYGIAKKHGVSLRALLDANPGVDPRRLRVGQKLVVPGGGGSGPATVATPAAAGGGASAGGEQVYVVQSGDNLTKIARRFGTTVQALREANQLRTDRIRVGDRLRIPAGATRAEAPAQAEPPPFIPPGLPSSQGQPGQPPSGGGGY